MAMELEVVGEGRMAMMRLPKRILKLASGSTGITARRCLGRGQSVGRREAETESALAERDLC